jgi:hypothetical protein
MKIITIIPVVILLLTTQAKANTVLSCLGKEELKIHIHNSQNYNYKLNQELVNILSSGNRLNFSKSEILEVCNSKQPSITLLHKLLVLSLNNKGIQETSSVKKYFLNVIKDRIRPIFFRYISTLQSASPTPTCLNDKIPTITIIQNRYRYLQNEVSAVKLITQTDLDKIFRKLIHIDNYFLECMKKIN